MSADILLTVMATAVAQSIFGVGILLFGTPILLLLGYDFLNVLSVLLPVSLAINLLQIANHHADIDFTFYRKIFLFTLPPIIISLFLATHIHIDISIIVGIFLLFVACKEFFPALDRASVMMKYEIGYFIVMGIVHGLSNLGGSLLTAMVHHKKYEKNVSRATVAISYATFAAVQLSTLVLGGGAQRFEVSLAANGIYLVGGVLVFLVVEGMIYAKIQSERYRYIFAVFLAISGLALLR